MIILRGHDKIKTLFYSVGNNTFYSHTAMLPHEFLPNDTTPDGYEELLMLDFTNLFHFLSIFEYNFKYLMDFGVGDVQPK